MTYKARTANFSYPSSAAVLVFGGYLPLRQLIDLRGNPPCWCRFARVRWQLPTSPGYLECLKNNKKTNNQSGVQKPLEKTGRYRKAIRVGEIRNL